MNGQTSFAGKPSEGEVPQFLQKGDQFLTNFNFINREKDIEVICIQLALTCVSKVWVWEFIITLVRTRKNSSKISKLS